MSRDGSFTIMGEPSSYRSFAPLPLWSPSLPLHNPRPGGLAITSGWPRRLLGMGISSSAAPTRITEKSWDTSQRRACMMPGLLLTGSWPPPDWRTCEASTEASVPTVMCGNNIPRCISTSNDDGQNGLARPLRPRPLPPPLLLALLPEQSLLVC